MGDTSKLAESGMMGFAPMLMGAGKEAKEGGVAGAIGSGLGLAPALMLGRKKRRREDMEPDGTANPSPYRSTILESG